jgi:hypothetical protein
VEGRADPGALRGNLINILVTDDDGAQHPGEAVDDHLLVIDAGTAASAPSSSMAGRQLGVGQEEWTHIAEPGVPARCPSYPP